MCLRFRLPLSCGLFSVLLLLVSAPEAAATVRINEVMASNGRTLADLDGNFEDWIELFNFGDEPVDLAGWGLSDKPNEPFLWTFPAGTIMAPGEYLLVWASGKDRVPGESVPGILREVYEGIPGVRVEDLTAYPAYPAHPSQTHVLTDLFEAPANVADNYGQRLSGVLTAPLDGTYRFWIAADDAGELHLSTDATAGNAVRIAEVPQWTASRQWTKFPQQASAPVELVAGGRYYIAAIMKEGTGSDHLSVRWERPDGVIEAPIPAEHVRTHPGDHHTNFCISSDGEELILTRPDGGLADWLPATRIPRDLSVGRLEGNGSEWRFFDAPTPGSANTTTAYLGILDPPSFSHEAGAYSAPFALELHAPTGAAILYTRDGSIPNRGNAGEFSYHFKNRYPQDPGDPLGPIMEGSVTTLEYVDPIEIDDRSTEPNRISEINTLFSREPIVPFSKVFKATVVRARSVADGYLPSPVVTASYFVHPEIHQRYELMIVSIAIDERDLFDYDTGISVPGRIGDQWRELNPHMVWNPGRPGNYHQRGPQWERDAHIEMFCPEGDVLLAQGVGLRLHGGWSRALAPRKSLRLYARAQYGEADSFDFPFFNGLTSRESKPRAISSFRRLILRNSGNDFDGTLFRDAVIQGLAAPLGLDHQAYRPVVHFINGEFWGINSFRERIDQHYLASHYGMDPDEVTILTREGLISSGLEVDRQHYLSMLSFAEAHDLADPEAYAHMATQMDIENFARYFAVQVYISNVDWPTNNIDYWRKRSPGYDVTAPEGHDGRWRWILYDLDLSFGEQHIHFNSLDRVVFTGGGRAPAWSTSLFRNLLQNQGFRDRFINQLNELGMTVFEPNRIHSFVDATSDGIESARDEHVSRWQSGGDRGTGIKNFASQRPVVIRQHLREVFGLPGAANLTVGNAHLERGRVRLNTFVIDADMPGIADPQAPYPWTGQYFRSVPVQLEAIAERGYRFAGWLLNGFSEVSPESVDPTYRSTSPHIELTLGGHTTIEAVFEEIPWAERPVGMHVWDFAGEGSVLVPAYTLGGGALTVAPGPATVVERNEAAQDFASAHLRVNDPLGATLTFAAPTTGYGAITVAYLTRRSGQGAGLQTLSYTTDGEVWTEVQTYAVHDDTPQAWEFDLGAVEGVADNPDFALRISFAEGEGGVAGNNRFDDIVVRGVALPGTNVPPFLLGDEVPDLLVASAGIAPTLVDPEPWYLDPEGEPLQFTVESSDPEVLAVAVLDGQLVLTGLAAGEAMIHVTAADGHNPPVATGTRVLVYPQPFALLEGDFNFEAWSADEPGGSYPPHMLFLQSERSDPGLTTKLLHPYAIPAGDAASPEDADFPYAASSRTRINGLGGDGVAFINTGRGRDLGAALLALDTRGVTDVDVSFVAGTVLPNSREYALRLEARTGTTGSWSDVLDATGEPVEYRRSAVVGDAATIGPIRLPIALKDQANLQLQWRYHHVDGDTGARAQLRLDDIVVTAVPMVPETLIADGLAAFLTPGILPPITVRVVDLDGFTVFHFNGEVSLSLTGEGALTGVTTVNAVNGVAVFEGLELEGLGAIELVATIGGLDPVVAAQVRVLHFEELMLPRYMQGGQDGDGNNFDRIPFAWRARLTGLEPGATYRYANRMVLDSQDSAPDADGAGNAILIPADGGDYVRNTASPRFRAEDHNVRHAELTADEAGTWEGWLITEPSGNARFTPGNELRALLLLNDGAGGEEPAWHLRTGATVAVLSLGVEPDDATAVYGELAAERGFVVLHDDPAGEGRPLSATVLEATGAEVDDRFAAFYHDVVAGVAGRWGSLIPNSLAGGLRRLELRDASGELEDVLDSAEGAEGTVLAGGGATAVWVPAGPDIRFLPPGDGRWDDPNHWTASDWPHGAGLAAVVHPPLAGSRSIMFGDDTDARIGAVTFTNGDFVNRIEGLGTLTFDGGSDGPAVLRVTDSQSGHTDVNLAAAVTLATDLVLETAAVEEDPLEPEYGALRLRGDWAGPGGLIKRGPGVASLTGEGKAFAGPLVVEEGVLRLTAPAAPGAAESVTVQPGGQLRLVSTGLDRTYAFGGPLHLAGMGRDPTAVPTGSQLGILGALRFDPPGNGHEAIVDADVVLTGTSEVSVSIHVDSSQNELVLTGVVSGEATLSKSGSGLLAMAGSSPEPLTFAVENGRLRVGGDYAAASVTLENGTILNGTGSLGAVDGSGAIEQSGAGGLSLQSLDVAHLRLEVAAGEGPWTLVRLRGAEPLGGGLTASHQVAVYLPTAHVAGAHDGVFFSDSGADLAALVSSATWSFFVADAAGTVDWNGSTWQPAVVDAVNFSTAEHTLETPEGPITGTILQVNLQQPPLAGFLTWSQARFSAAQLDDPAVSGPTAQPLQDGHANLLKYALGLGPYDRIGPDHVGAGLDQDGRIHLRFVRAPDRFDIAYVVEAANHPDGPWTEVLYDSRTDTQPNNDGTHMRITDPGAEPPDSATRFLRLKVIPH